MELNFTEIDTGYDNFDVEKYETINKMNNTKYWENIKKLEREPVKRKKVSFDDILSNMNLVVNQNGVLQYMAPIQNLEEHPMGQYHSESNNTPLDPNVKHSYIYNKYFKDYKDANGLSNIPPPRIPQTLEEYKQMVLEDRVRAIQERNRIAKIKSTKMLYTNNITNSGQINTNVALKASKNNLRRMSFR